MAAVREPVLLPVAVGDLRPTQITVGMREVAIKRKVWRDRSNKKGREFLGRHMIPVIWGPKERYYVIDHHHMVLALREEGVKDVLVATVADFRKVPPALFWPSMDARNWVHPFDDKGRRRDYDSIPKSIGGMIDDPFRSLAGELRRIGGYAKEAVPFSEFQWADFLRHHIKRSLVEKEFTRALERALTLAKSADADYLPGWCGPSPED